MTISGSLLGAMLKDTRKWKGTKGLDSKSPFNFLLVLLLLISIILLFNFEVKYLLYIIVGLIIIYVIFKY